MKNGVFWDVAVAKLRNYKFPGSEQILVELIQAGCETLPSSISKLSSYI
jgi:hypothetical protein